MLENKKIVIIIPAYNEENSIEDVIKNIPRNIEGIDRIEIVVIDDGSTDNTVKFTQEAGTDVISHGINKGVGSAFHTGVNEALRRNADLMVNIDGDGQFNPKTIPILIKPILENQADFVSCSRFKDPSLIPKMSKIKKWGNRQIARLISYLIGQKVYDVSCGFRAYSREALLRLNLFGKYTYTHESFLNLAFQELRIKEIPLKVKGEREFGNSHVAGNLFKYGYYIFNIIFRTVLDYKPLRFFGWMGILIFFIGILLDLIILIFYLETGQFSPYKSLGFIGAFLNIFGIIIFIIGLIADMLNRVRMTQERILYLRKKEFFKRK